MPILHNLKPRLIWGPPVRGFKTPQWLPGSNYLDATYWETAKKHGTIRRFLNLEFIRVEDGRDLPDPSKPPSDEDLAAFTPRELKAALKNPDVPMAWHTMLEAELVKRKEPVPEEPEPTPEPELEPVESEITDIATETDVDKLIALAAEDESLCEAVDDRLVELEGDDGNG